MPCICLHMIISSQCGHLHACCVTSCDSVSAACLRVLRMFACMSQHVLPLLGVMSLFRTSDDHSADHHLSPCSRVDLVTKQGRARHKQLEYFYHVYQTIHLPNIYGVAFIFSSYLSSLRQSPRVIPSGRQDWVLVVHQWRINVSTQLRWECMFVKCYST